MVRPGQSSHPAPSARDRRDPIGAAIERLFPASGAGPLEWPLLDARVDGPAIPRPPVQRKAGGIRPSEGGPVRAAVLGAGRVAGETVGAEESQPAASSDGLAEASRRRFGRVPALGFATAPNASTYRAVMAVFAGAQAHYKPQLRADEVLDALDAEGYEFDLPDNDEMAPLRQIEAVLEMLEGWTLVRHSQDNTPARTKTEFLRQRHLWQITEIGEAAHRAALSVEETIGRTGSLQKDMLHAIERDLAALLALGTGADAAEAGRIFVALDGYFRELTSNAQVFMANLDRLTTSSDIDREVFLLVKGAVLDYVTDFLADLRTMAPKIEGLLRGFGSLALERLVGLASRSGQMAVGFDGGDPAARRAADLRLQWTGLAAWFLAADGEPPTVRLLEAKAQSAVANLMRVLERLTEARSRRFSRAADFVRLAHWFAESESDEAAHALWRSAFGLGAARHFRHEVDDPEAISGAPSWLDVPPVHVATHLRARGDARKRGRISPIEDTSGARAILAADQARRFARAEAALARLIAQGSTRLSALGRLDDDSFDLVLDVLAHALPVPPDEAGRRLVASVDGSFEIVLGDPPAGAPRVMLETRDGALGTPDFSLEIRPLAALAATARSA